MNTKTNVDRELILRITIKDEEKSQWIWKGYREAIDSLGVQIHEIAEGKYYKITSKDGYPETGPR